MSSSAPRKYRSRTSENSSTKHRSRVKRMPFFSSEHSFFHPRGFGVQHKLTANAPDDIYEKEADAKAERVMHMSDPLIQRQPIEEEEEMLQMKEQVPAIQRKCKACETEESLQRQSITKQKYKLPGIQRKCTECEKEEREHLQRKPLAESTTSYFQRKEAEEREVNQQTEASLQSTKSSGKPLPKATRSWMEDRFGTDFSGVNVHTDNNAVQLSRDLNARAFTYGRDIYFNQGEFSPETSEGKRLLAHELTHVVQQNSNLSKKSTVQRSVRTNQTNCPANINNAPADPITALQGINDTAVRFARGTARLLEFSALLVQAGDQGFVDDEYERAFGLPQASGGGFVNRLTGQVRPTRNIALSEEMNLFSKRFELVADFLEQPIAYRCDPPLSWGGCNFSACDANDNAAACTGTGAIKVCPNFWNHGEEAQAGILIHEVTHIYWAGATHNLPSNLRLSQCYEELVAQIYGFNARSQVCPAP